MTGVTLVESANIDWYIMRPVMRDPPLCTLRELKDGTYSLNDLADFHEAMDEEWYYQKQVADARAGS